MGRRKRSKRKRPERNPPASLLQIIQSTAKKRFRRLISRGRDETNENVEVNNDEDIAEATRIEIQGIQTPTPIERRLEDGNASAGFLQTVQKSVLNGFNTLGSKIKITFKHKIMFLQ